MRRYVSTLSDMAERQNVRFHDFSPIFLQGNHVERWRKNATAVSMVYFSRGTTFRSWYYRRCRVVCFGYGAGAEVKAFCDEQIDGDDDDGFDEKVSKKALAEKAATATYCCTQHWPLKLRAPAGRAKPTFRIRCY